MNFKNLDCDCGWCTTVRLGDVAVPKLRNVIRLPITEAKYITKCSLFILLPGVIRQLGLKLNRITDDEVKNKSRIEIRLPRTAAE